MSPLPLAGGLRPNSPAKLDREIVGAIEFRGNNFRLRVSEGRCSIPPNRRLLSDSD